MQIQKNSRQMPSEITCTKDKNYCDLLYAWLQCHSSMASDGGRYIYKNDISFSGIEKSFTRVGIDGNIEKAMTRKTIAKYFNFLLEKGLIEEREEYYYLGKINPACYIEYNTLNSLINVFKRHSVDIYIYLFNRYYANECEEYFVAYKHIKEYIGVSKNTTSNNAIITDTLDILQRLGLISYSKIYVDNKTNVKINWVKNKLPAKTSVEEIK